MISLDDLKSIISDRFKMDVSVVSGDSTLEDLGFDSLSQLDLSQAINKKHGVKIPDDDLDSIATIDDVLNYVNGTLS